MTTKIPRITIVGVGALGSHVLLLSRNFKADFTVIDFDIVETKNTQSQMHTVMSLRKNKALSLQQAMRSLFRVEVGAVPHKLTADNVMQLLGPADVVLDCLDNAESRRVVQQFVRDTGKECLHGALAGAGGFGRAIWDEHFNVDDEGRPGAATCEDGEQLPLIAQVSSYIALALQQFLADGKKLNYNVTPTGIRVL